MTARGAIETWGAGAVPRGWPLIFLCMACWKKA